MTVVRALYNRFEHLVHEVSKFGAVGAVALVVNSGVFNAFLVAEPGKQIYGRVTATALATCVAYVGNRYWTYKDRDKIDRRREMFFFFLVNGVAMVIEVMFVFISKYGLGQDGTLAMNVASYVFGLPLGMLFRLHCYRTFIFPEGVEAAREPQPQPQPQPVHQPEPEPRLQPELETVPAVAVSSRRDRIRFGPDARD
ncbi:putative flippase GtrA [Catenulispora sp. MAP12-49]|uniref:GtrA family protein n=1 Tax=Catenulispora sp. MAP12-49 TaxID=3156302 RepID=UPI0035172D9D